MDSSENDKRKRAPWIVPDIAELDVQDTAIYPNRGADGSPFVDCQRS